MQTFKNTSAAPIVLSIADRIVENRAYLSEIDGKIGDGDHGVNMAKGFGMAAERLKGQDASLGQSFEILGSVLMNEIGGSMGPLYGVMFTEFAEQLEGREDIDPKTFSAMLHAGLDGIQSIGSAKVGDKTLLDALVPAIEAFDDAVASGEPFETALQKLVQAAEAGRDSTIDLVAKIGRSSRLGDRSLGVLDAGATSCAIILKQLSLSAQERLR
ncbi:MULTISPECIES: dihydroxyacetone kinase subunit DhaL [unclassified Rhizobium]|uniref:dihydroxyacetone kinase subunit DhaL n=1 Tax=unclassified Rhizobium TaxID=2613769 RepID=UPI001ADC061C|nr:MULTISPECIES: dihydroxyacetone kinase subunit DhaL [unclassified Rhizobium]MBO9100931.1 dihydroxyacetone kinase subunit L [Rhizobium sp. L58/93]MBO9136697.1 dihydroxyacetone kinase subunit L [Rhizobium sp. B209b/85]MBO9186533.1 dihydroxyacetone kinase subunit L [Rhizobium sp. E27B/91]QXZ83268.1 dihydroxyacetone kinase subunit L [Rhizobium sp. K1/93]QXZ89220.1 dihydroxyacetone kinase subunit L [Rhizobium sp. K15/93]